MKPKKKKLVFLVNPHSADCEEDSVLAELKRGLSGYSYVVHFPDSVDALAKVCADLDFTLCESVIVVGGDGTFNRTIPHLLNKNIPIYIMPRGASNHLAKYLGCTNDSSQLQKLIQNGQHAPIDLVNANNFVFATVGGVGLGADLGKNVSLWRKNAKLKKILTFVEKLGNLSKIFRKVVFQKESVRKIKVTLDGSSNIYTTSGIFVCNQPQQLGKTVVAAQARNDDGKLEVLILLDEKKTDIIRSLVSLKRGIVPPRVLYQQVETLSLESLDNQPLEFYGDGEKLISDLVIKFSIMPQAVRIYSAHFEHSSDAERKQILQVS